MKNERYLGDGVYATVTDFDVTLDLRGQDNTTRIVMEPQVIVALVTIPEVLLFLKDSHHFRMAYESVDHKTDPRNTLQLTSLKEMSRAIQG